MSEKVFLRVDMSERQVREACADWARSRARLDDAAVQVELASNGMTNTEITADVVFIKKRERKAKVAQ